MIIVAGNPFDISLLTEYAGNSVEYQVLKAMNDSAETYAYGSLAQLAFELKLRKEIVNAAIALNRSRFSFAIFSKSRCNPLYYDCTANGGFKLKNNVRPSDAINDIFLNGQMYATECATAMVIVYYKALLHVFGADAFNRTFKDIYLMNWQINDPLLREVGIPKRVSELLLGDRGYINNPDVDPATPQWQGENVIVLPQSMYYGHGIGITTAQQMINTLNTKRKRNATRSAYLMDSAARPNFNRIFSAYQSATATI